MPEAPRPSGPATGASRAADASDPSDPVGAFAEPLAQIVGALLGPVSTPVASVLAVLSSAPAAVLAACLLSAAAGVWAARRARYWRFFRIAYMEGHVQKAPQAARANLRARSGARTKTRRRPGRRGDDAKNRPARHRRPLPPAAKTRAQRATDRQTNHPNGATKGTQ